MNEYFLKPGHLIFSTEPILIKTVLGSCVSVCIWDRVLKYGAMNHYIFAKTLNKKEATPQFGNVSLITLIKIMLDASSEIKNLIAQILGGAQNENVTQTDIGYENVEIARKILAKKKIRINSEDVGGSMGRKVIFDTANGEVGVLKVHQIRNEDWYA